MIYWALLIFLFSSSGFANIESFGVAPAKTDLAITQIKGEHQIWQQPAATKLLVSLGGTGSEPEDFHLVDELAAAMGYNVIALDYPDQVISTVCRDHPTADCFDLFRADIVSGVQGSPWVNVDAPNCIESRLRQLLKYLVKVSPKPWTPFIAGSEPNWTKITVIGHSQGAGNAAYFSKLHAFQGAILLAGPQDISAAGVAKWVSRDSATDRQHIRALLHEKDFFDETKQLAILRVLLQQPKLEPTVVSTDPPSEIVPIVETNLPEQDPHVSVIRSKAYAKIWRYLLN